MSGGAAVAFLAVAILVAVALILAADLAPPLTGAIAGGAGLFAAWLVGRSRS